MGFNIEVLMDSKDTLILDTFDTREEAVNRVQGYIEAVNNGVTEFLVGRDGITLSVKHMVFMKICETDRKLI